MNGDDMHRFPFDCPPPNDRKHGEAVILPLGMGSARSGLASTQSGLSTNPSIRTAESSIDRSSADSFEAVRRSLLDDAAKKEHKREKKEKKAKEKKEKKDKKEKKHKKEKKRSKDERISEDSFASQNSAAHLVAPLEEPPASRQLSNQTAHTTPMSPSPNATKKKYISDELEARGVRLRGEPKLDKMLQVAMELSLKDFRRSRRTLMSEPREREESRFTSVALQDAHVDQNGSTVQDGRPDHERQGSHRSLFSQANEMTEVVVEDPRGKIQAQRRFSTRNLIPHSKSLSESHMDNQEGKLPARTSIRYPDYDPKSKLFDNDPKARLFDQEQAPAQRSDDPNDPLYHWTESDVRKKFFDEEFDEELFSQVPRRPPQRPNRQASTGPMAAPDDQTRPIDQIRLARQNLSAQEAVEIERALRDAGEVSDERITRRGPVRGSAARKPRQRETCPPSSPNVPDVNASAHLSPEEAAEIARALQEADDEEARKSFQLALELQSQEATLFTSQRQLRARQAPQAREGYPVELADGDGGAEAGYRANAARRPPENGDRVRNQVVEPNNLAQASRRVGVDDDDAYNSFRQSMQRQKSVTRSGRASSFTNSGAMDPRVRMLITRAINNRLIEKCNGIVREGKEAVIYHADQGEEGGGYDVAIKVYTHIEEVQERSDYVDGDPRFDGKFRNASNREKLEMWAEKEYRNLLRANRSGVPVPTPLIQKENVVFMRFLGEDRWGVPQLKDLQIRKGSDKWTTFYSQIMVAIRRLFHGARLVHGDLSENNILICPARLVENRDEGFGPNDDGELQAVLIDFGQAVDWRHPSAMELLDRDLAHVREFFIKKGVKTLALHMAHEFVTAPEPDQDDETTVGEATATAGTNGAANAAQNDSASLSQDRASAESDEFLRPSGDSWANGADAFQGSSWPAEWSEFDKQN